jgi:hypothetical protein
VLKLKFGPKRDELTGEWRELDNEKLYDLYSSPNIILMIKTRKNVMGRSCSKYGEKRDAYRPRKT